MSPVDLAPRARSAVPRPELLVHDEPGAEVLTIGLAEPELRRLWERVAAVRPALLHFSPSPLMATAAIEALLGDALGDGWVEIRRVPGGMVGSSGWVLRASGLDALATERLRAILEGAKRPSTGETAGAGEVAQIEPAQIEPAVFVSRLRRRVVPVLVAVLAVLAVAVAAVVLAAQVLAAR